MKPFNHEEALKGKLCKTYNGMYVLIKADTNEDARINPKPAKPLIGLIFDGESTCIAGYWDYNGKGYLDTDNLNIIGILEDNEVRAIKNLQLLENAMRDNKYVQWYESGINGLIAVEKKLENGNFILGFGKWKYETNGGGLINLHIVK